MVDETASAAAAARIGSGFVRSVWGLVKGAQAEDEERKGAAMAAPGENMGLLAQGLSTGGLQGWIQSNVVPLILLAIAIILLWIGGRGDNAGVARRSIGLIIGLIALGIAVSGNGPKVGEFLASLIVS